MRTSPLFRALLSFRLLTFFAMSLLIENRGVVDKISRYVSRSDVEEAIGGLAVDISPGQIYRKKVSLSILLTYRLILSTASHSRERTNKVRSGQSRQLCYLTGRGPQVPPAQRISTAMQPLPASKVSGAGVRATQVVCTTRASRRYTRGISSIFCLSSASISRIAASASARFWRPSA